MRHFASAVRDPNSRPSGDCRWRPKFASSLTQSVRSDTITYDTAHDTISSTRAQQHALEAGESRPAQRVTIVFAPPASQPSP